MPPFALHDVEWPLVFKNLAAAALFGVLGIILLLLGFKLFELITPHVEVEKKLQEGNVAVGIVVGALLIAISIVVAVAIF